MEPDLKVSTLSLPFSYHSHILPIVVPDLSFHAAANKGRAYAEKIIT